VPSCIAQLLIYNQHMNLVELAQRIRSCRIDRRMTLEEVAAGTGLTRSWLSKVENFRVTPSLPALAKIAARLNISLAELVQGLDDKPPLVIVRKGERKAVARDRSKANKTIYESLAHKRANRSMDPFLLTVPPGAARKAALAHEGEEFLMVQSGEIDFEYDGERHSLREGDSLYFDGNIPHRLINNSKRAATVLCVFSEPQF
jgi:transcriptional regulator with XRE-family HTH domain